jgi:hypothetical protein
VLTPVDFAPDVVAVFVYVACHNPHVATPTLTQKGLLVSESLPCQRYVWSQVLFDWDLPHPNLHVLVFFQYNGNDVVLVLVFAIILDQREIWQGYAERC